MPSKDPNQGGFFPNVYKSALAQNSQDYDKIMGDYDRLKSDAFSSSGNSQKMNFSPVSPSFSEYSPGNDFSELRDLATTGGLNEEEQGSLRARAISPIRSIYDSASRGLNRQKSLQGGYSPNFGAVTSKLARESSNLIGSKTTDANAAIAEMVQRGKLSSAPQLAQLESRENEFRNNIIQQNNNTANDFMKFNATAPLSYAQFNAGQDNNDFDNILKTIQGQQSLFGTTPAMTSTVGNQALSAANVVNNFAPVKRGSMSSMPYRDYSQTPVAGANRR